MCEYMQDIDREQYEKALFASRNEQKVFKYLKSFQRDSLPPVMRSEASNFEARTAENKARLFNEFFASVVTDEDYAYFEPSRRQLYGKGKVYMAEAGTRTELKKLDPIKSRGNDPVPPILLKKIGGCYFDIPQKPFQQN